MELVLYLCKILIACLGSFGPQCSKTCLPGFYGFGCKMKCTCGVCDRFNGSCLEGKLYDDWSYNKFVAQIKFIFHAFKLITFVVKERLFHFEFKWGVYNYYIFP